jgi:hypothetical protein
MKKANRWIWIFAVIFLFLCYFSCRKQNTEEGAYLNFSSNQILFDTVFTSISSVTKYFTVKNSHNFDLKFRIFLAGGKQSFFSINVDGQAGTSFSDVIIPAKDSIFIFVKANIHPSDQNMPFLVTDSVVFMSGNVLQDVDLLAYGQDAHFVVGDKELSMLGSVKYKIVAGANETVTWSNNKPYVIYGAAVVDSLGKLIIEAGTQIYVHKNGLLWIAKDGNIEVNGTATNPVVFQGDRREEWYQNDYEQWNRIWINEGTKNNYIRHAIITNAVIGIQLESWTGTVSNTTYIENTIIKNTAASAVLARMANANISNSLFYNNGGGSLLLHVGNFNLKHVTIANDFSVANSNREMPSLYVSNYYEDNLNQILESGNTRFSAENCIIVGNKEIEYLAQKRDPLELTLNMENCLLKVTESQSYFQNCLINSDPKFKDRYASVYLLSAESPAIDAGKTGIGIWSDILGNVRDNKPDLGAYEYQP